MTTIKTPHTKQEFKEYYALRYHVLREPLGLPKGTEKDDYEVISEHFMAVDDSTGEIVGVVKLYEDEPGLARFSTWRCAKTSRVRASASSWWIPWKNAPASVVSNGWAPSPAPLRWMFMKNTAMNGQGWGKNSLASSS